MKNIKKLINLTCSNSISKRDEASEELCDIIRNKLKYAMGYIAQYAHLFEGFDISSLKYEINNRKCYPFKTFGRLQDINGCLDYSRGYIQFEDESDCYAEVPIKWLEVDSEEFDKILDEFAQNSITSLLDLALKVAIDQINRQTGIKKRAEEKLVGLNKLK